MAGEDVTTIQTWMGHAHISTTQIYMHYAPKRDAAARISQAFVPVQNYAWAAPPNTPPIAPPTEEFSAN